MANGEWPKAKQRPPTHPRINRMRTQIALSALVFAATSHAQMLQGVAITPDSVRLAPGQSVVVRANGRIGCCSKFPWHVSFGTTDGSIATASGGFASPVIAADVTVVAHRPGITSIVTPAVSNGAYPLATIEVVCEAPLAITAEAASFKTIPGQSVTLRVVAADPPPTLSWYLGRAGDTSQPLSGTSTELMFRPDVSGTHWLWVLAVGPCGTARAEFKVDAFFPHRRAAGRNSS